MNELEGLVVLLAGFGALAVAGCLAAACLRLRSPIEFLLATYLLGWTWLVGASLALSPTRSLTRGSLLAAIGVGLVAAVVVWHFCGRPALPDPRPALAQARRALREPVILVLAAVVALANLYVGALAFLTPANDWDALSYHLARASFWLQEHGIAYIADVADPRLNVNPPNAEIGQLATMVLAGNDRYVALPQLLAYGALTLSVAGLSRRIGLGHREALFAALAFATLPVLVLQAPTALNDLVVTSFLAAATLFVLRAGRVPLLLVALAVGLAIGTKFSGLLCLPTLAVVAAFGRPPRHWPATAAAVLAGLAAGSAWYVVNIVENGSLDGGAAEELDQQAGQPGAATVVSALRLALGFVDMPGAPFPIALFYVLAAGILVGIGLFLIRRSRALGVAVLVGAALTASVLALPLAHWLGVKVVYKTGLVLGTPLAFLDEVDWQLNTLAEPTFSWFGPLGLLLLGTGSVAVVVAWRRRMLPALSLALAAAPWLLLATLALTLTWDPWRGRFLVFGVALAAATWGILLRSTAISTATAAIGATALFLTLGNHASKPSGLFAEASIWGRSRSEIQTSLSGQSAFVKFVTEDVPEDAHIALALPGNHHIHPYFGPRISRRISLVAPGGGGRAAAESEWLIMAPGTRVRRCPGSWDLRLAENRWRIERRVAPDDCLTG